MVATAVTVEEDTNENYNDTVPALCESLFHGQNRICESSLSFVDSLVILK